MNRSAVLCALALILLSAPAPAARRKAAGKVDILNDRDFRTTDYASLYVGKVTADKYLDSIRDIKQYDRVEEELDDMTKMLRMELDDYARHDFRGGKKGKDLRVSVIVRDYHSGSLAAAVWVGGGNGSITLEVRFFDGKTEVAAFETTHKIRRVQHGGWGRQDPTGSESRRQITKLVTDQVDDFLNSH